MDNLLNMVWSEKYRPLTLEDCILPKNVKDMCEQIIKDGVLPNLLLYSKAAGVGKTTLAKVLASELGYDVLEINGSSDRNIDTLRGQITSFCSAFSMSGKRKIVLIDEADYLNPTSTQPALRNFIQSFSTNVSFVFTCNYVNKLIDPLRSRFSQVNFDFDPIEKKRMMTEMMKRSCFILDQEGVEYDPKVVAYYVKNNYPDFRSVINEIQKVAKSGPLLKVLDSSKGDVDKLKSIIKNRKFKDMREWVAENHSLGIDWVANVVYKHVSELFDEEYQAEAITVMYDYMYKDKFAVSPEICMAACLSELFLRC